MAVETLTSFPSSFVAGDTLRVTLSDGDYPSSDWALRVYFRGPVLKNFAAEAGEGNDYELVIAASDTAKLTPGSYEVTFAYTDGDGERKTVNVGNVQVIADPTASVAKSEARQILEAMEGALLTVAKKGTASVSAGGHQFTFKTMKECQDAIDRQRAIVAAEDARASLAAGTRRSGNIFTRFSRPYSSD